MFNPFKFQRFEQKQSPSETERDHQVFAYYRDILRA